MGGVEVDTGTLAKARRVMGQGRFENVMSPSSLLCLVQGVAGTKETGDDETGKIRQGRDRKQTRSVYRLLVTRCRG